MLTGLFYIGNFNIGHLRTPEERFMLSCLGSNESKLNLIPALRKQMLASANCVMALPGLPFCIFFIHMWDEISSTDVQVSWPENEFYPYELLVKLNKVLVGCSLSTILD